jgi:NAD(P)-dependent dehydrogenase (short-subunit alcohol dehydrogenase family)
MPVPQQKRIALVTGATQGIGAAIARRLARDGVTVGVNGLAHDERMRTVIADTAGFPAVGDISDPDVIGKLVDDIETTHGPIDVLVCNAAYMTMAPFLDDDEEDWWKIIDTNLAGTLHLIQSVLAGMRRAGRRPQRIRRPKRDSSRSRRRWVESWRRRTSPSTPSHRGLPTPHNYRWTPTMRK